MQELYTNSSGTLMVKRLRKDLRCRLTPATKERLKREPWLRKQALYIGSLLPRETTKPIASRFLQVLREEYEQAVFHGSFGPFWEEKNTEYRGAYLEAAVAIIDEINNNNLSLALTEAKGGARIDPVNVEVNPDASTRNAAFTPSVAGGELASTIQTLERNEIDERPSLTDNEKKVKKASRSDASPSEASVASESGKGELTSIKSMLPQNMFQLD